MPSELQRCSVTGKLALREYLTTISVSSRLLLKSVAVPASSNDNFCLPDETAQCAWSGESSHPADLATCAATGLRVHKDFLTKANNMVLAPMSELLGGLLHAQNATTRWSEVAARVESLVGGGRVRVQAAVLPPDQNSLACRCEVKTFLGMVTNQVGVVFSLSGTTVIGRIVKPDAVRQEQRRRA